MLWELFAINCTRFAFGVNGANIEENCQRGVWESKGRVHWNVIFAEFCRDLEFCSGRTLDTSAANKKFNRQAMCAGKQNADKK